MRSIFLLAALFLVSCSRESKEISTNQESDIITIENCGIDMDFEKKPTKVVCIGQHTVELLIALGLKENIVGWAFPDSYPTPSVKVISQQYPSKEVFYEHNPDFVFSGYKGAFTQEQIGTRENLKSRGINTYLPVGRCIEVERAAVFEDVYSDIINLGEIFKIEEKAQSLVDSLENDLSIIDTRIVNVDNHVDVMVFGGGYTTGTLLVDGGYSLSSDLIRRSGGRNVFQDIKKQNVEVNVEEIILRNPQVIIVKSSLGDPNAEKSLEYLFTNPSLREVAAVKDSSIVILPFTSTLPGIRNLDAIEAMTSVFLTSY
jgi:iron complex transport system substrate-binding protein